MISARYRSLCRVAVSASATLTAPRARRHSFDRGENLLVRDRPGYGHRFQSCATLTPFPHPLLSQVRTRQSHFFTISLFFAFLPLPSSLPFFFPSLFFSARTYLALARIKNARSLDDITSGIRRCQNDGVARPARRTLLQSE